MKKLTNEQIERKQALEEVLQEKEVALVVAVQALNEHLATTGERILVLQEEYNDAVRSAEAFREEVASEQESHFDGMSDRWKGSDTGQAYEAWAAEWASGFDEVDAAVPDDMDLPDFTALEALRTLAAVP